MRKGLAVFLALVLLVTGGVALAAFYKVATLSAPFSVEEPIVVGGWSMNPDQIYPGETATALFTVKNQATETSYGMAYNGLLCFKETERPLVVCEGWVFPLSSQSVAEEGEIVLDKPEGEIFPPPPGPLGKVWIYVDPDGPAGPKPETLYRPGEVVLLPAGGDHWVRVMVRPAASAPPGSWFLEFQVERGEPPIQIFPIPE